MTEPTVHATADELALLRVLNDNGPITPEDAVNVYGAPSGLLEEMSAKDWTRRWIRRGDDTGMFQLTAAGWAEIDYADNPPTVDGPPSEG